ncbi:hypothetical protein N7519_004125 [Penicillium mononematosum]|uniref:uncharacterized protein n=1 Tax=Penicillium mononematosum TaxID=268346 RepID=UPI002546DEB4|nr:uncharacterized protein N7519_004125 [Penicillium mononematosum]KAJ6189217.1 hypothetical protein N7519_004125 [Penicillium mononematosum]
MAFLSTDNEAAINRTRGACNTRNRGIFWHIPVEAPACASMPAGNMAKVMEECCNGASVTQYADGCGIYCLANGQDPYKLGDCIHDQNAYGLYSFCTLGYSNSTTSSSKSTSSDTTTSTASPVSSTSPNAATTNQPISKSGLGLTALLFGSAFMAVI